ncbi:related to ubiquitin-conjugating enzyme CDC34 [Cephalotrichum gorgonifer]|uniref:Ubiquitin-conjugating enzyme E2 2 n=1 Tax=Cephalotrichum gorgonifer TaxID=2041049 RepID=A0AAE8SS08_9PEZI|nr:related to ubiquitin-conjugating enzyme CDC34 [Cephalotrichum gorgonifer]
MAEKRLLSELQALQKEKWVHIEVDDANIKKWNIGLMVVNPDSVFSGGYFKAEMTFAKDYPYVPPTFRFQTRIYHPNIYSDGRLCISILHAPGEDEMSGEQASERWSPLQGVESVLRSVLLLLDDPEINSAANVDASVTYRDKRGEYDARAKATVEKSRAEMPKDVKFPTSEDLAPAPVVAFDDDDFWNESDGNDDFGSESESDFDDNDMDDD